MRDNFFAGRKRNVEHLIGESQFKTAPLCHFPLFIEVDDVGGRGRCALSSATRQIKE
jgi:hypothetical protein